jgi:hypothetical protein
MKRVAMVSWHSLATHEVVETELLDGPQAGVAATIGSVIYAGIYFWACTVSCFTLVASASAVEVRLFEMLLASLLIRGLSRWNYRYWARYTSPLSNSLYSRLLYFWCTYANIDLSRQTSATSLRKVYASLSPTTPTWKWTRKYSCR